MGFVVVSKGEGRGRGPQNFGLSQMIEMITSLVRGCNLMRLPVTVVVTAHHHKEYDEHQEESSGDSVHDGRGHRDGDRVVSHDDQYQDSVGSYILPLPSLLKYFYSYQHSAPSFSSMHIS